MSSLVFLMLLEAAAAATDVRVRAGVEIGPALAHQTRSEYTLTGIAITGRIGLQLHPMVAVAYQGGTAFFGGEVTFGDISEDPAYFALQNTPMLIVTPVDFFELGIGPALDVLIEEQDFNRDTAFAPGVDARVAFHIPLGPQEARRFGLGIAFDFRPTNVAVHYDSYPASRSDYDFWLLHCQLGVGVDWY